MGVPKQRWTAEEEDALKAGVLKHGVGKWRSIIQDPEFREVLYSRSNVDLKDKWRNISVISIGFGSREKYRGALKRILNHSSTDKHEKNTTTVSDVPQSEEEMPNIKNVATSSAPIEISNAPKRSIVRLDNLILEAITNLKELGGSNKTSIASYIEDQCWAPPDFKQILSAKLKYLTSIGKLIKVKHNYQISPSLAIPEKTRNHPMLAQEIRQVNLPKRYRNDIDLSMLKTQIDVELAQMRSMTPEDAAAAASRAVAEAEIAIAEAEKAEREADEAEAYAKEAQAFVAHQQRCFEEGVPLRWS